MRHRGETSPPAAPGQGGDWHTLQRLLPYLWEYKWRVLLALAFMVGAKLANVGVPMLLKELVDAMSLKPGDARALLVVPVALLLTYGGLRLATSAFTELRELVFAKATQGAARAIALQTFEHLHALSLRFHLARQTGGMTRDIERGVRGIESLISYSLYSIVPTLIEVGLVLSILAVKFDAWFAWITMAALALYIFFTVRITEWRTQFRRQANEFDSAAHTKAIDSLLNYETVKYFGNEAFEARRYDESLERLRRARLKAQTTLSLLNTGQQLIIAAALVAIAAGEPGHLIEERLPPGTDTRTARPGASRSSVRAPERAGPEPRERREVGREVSEALAVLLEREAGIEAILARAGQGAGPGFGCGHGRASLSGHFAKNPCASFRCNRTAPPTISHHRAGLSSGEPVVSRNGSMNRVYLIITISDEMIAMAISMYRANTPLRPNELSMA